MTLETRCGGVVQVEMLRRQDNSERLRQAEDQLSEVRAELDKAREREGQARQAAALAEQQSRQQQQQLTEVRRQAMWENMDSFFKLCVLVSPIPSPPPLPPLLSLSEAVSCQVREL